MVTIDSSTKKIAQNAIIAAVYFVLTLALSDFSFGQIQFRLAEILVLLCFWRPDFIFGVTLGCFLANINSTLGPWDLLIGTSATFLSCLLVSFASPRMFIACFYPIVFNAFIVAFELWCFAECGYWISVLYVGIGEASVIFVSYILWLFLSRNEAFMRLVNPTRHQNIRW